MTRPPEVIAASGEVNLTDEQIMEIGHRHFKPEPDLNAKTKAAFLAVVRECIAATAKTALQHFADEVEASGEPEKHAADGAREQGEKCQYAADVGMTEYRCVGKCQYALTAPGAASHEQEALSLLGSLDLERLARFQETTEDDQTFDIDKEAVKRLCELGCIQSQGFGRYGITRFGTWALQCRALASPSADADELDLIDAAISHLQQARSALNREQPETATGRGYVQDARAALAKVQS